MFLGLGVTAGVAYITASSPSLLQLLASNRILLFGLIGAEFGLVMYLSARVATIAPGTAAGLFLLYSGLNGATLSLVLLAYTGSSVASTFVVCSGTFAALAVYGNTTSRSLAGMGQFMFMGLIGLVLASIVGIFWQSNMLQFGIACAGVLVFTGLTAWDAQRLKQMALALPGGESSSFAVVGALSLYLDFINLFLFMLRLFGDRRR
jgi:FtsH-binding integral membrane protein